jgi:hypothetical protein
VTSRDFCYWLQGFFELADSDAALTDVQVRAIKAHLAMVFAHEIDPSQGTPEHRAELQELHDRKKPCSHPIGTRACTRHEGHDGEHAFDAKQADRNEAVDKRLEDLERALKYRRGHPEPIKLMC